MSRVCWNKLNMYYESIGDMTMKTLIAEDDITSQVLLREILSPFGECHVAVDGKEAVEAFETALADQNPYDLLCLDIMMPEMDGQEALKQVRELEKQTGNPGSPEVKVIMISALDDPKNVVEAYYKGGATDYLIKPVKKTALLEMIRELDLI